jgi:redox-sensitive bicupin YhaK (pirin superfamily)
MQSVPNPRAKIQLRRKRPIALRRIGHRTRGERRGPVTRLVDPTGLGELIKPFVLLDYFDVVPQAVAGFGIHPHSGIGTFTLMLEGNLRYEDTTGKSGLLTGGSLEWMRAGAGVWHAGHAADCQRLHGLQLWVTLPRDLEEAPAESQYIPAQEVQADGPAEIAMGRYGGARSPVRMPESMNYLHVHLKSGEHWVYHPPAGHEIAWAFVYAGQLETPDPALSGELVMFEESTEPLEFVAVGDTDFVLGSAIKHPHELVLGYYSIHTSHDSLARGAEEIARIGETLHAAGKVDEEGLRRMVERVRAGNW